MRIISGKYKARRIPVPHNITARPTTDFAKEGLFNLLHNEIELEDITALDLFGGTGSISLELISRGAKQVVCVEKWNPHCTFIKKVCTNLSIDKLILIRGDVFRFVTTTKQQYDFIFADPPYEMETLTTLPDLIFENNLLAENGLFVLEHSAKNSFTQHHNFFQHKKYGNVNFSFFKQTQQESIKRES